MPPPVPGSCWSRDRARRRTWGRDTLGSSERTAGRDPERVIRHLISSGELNIRLKGRTRVQTVTSPERSLLIRTQGQDGDGFITTNSAAFDPRLFSVEFNRTR